MREEYGYACAYVKSLESNMLSDADFQVMLGFDDEKKIEDFLKSRGYDGEKIGDMTENERRKTEEICLGLCGGNMRKLLGTQRDFHNIKAVIGAALSKAGTEELVYEPSEIDCGALYGAVGSGSFEELEEYADICREALETYKKSGFAAMTDFVDESCIVRLASLSEENKFAHGWAELKAENFCLKAALFGEDCAKICEKLGMESVADTADFGGEYKAFESSPVRFEKTAEDRVTEYLKKAHTEFFSFAPILGYLEGKRTEIVNIRLIAYGKMCGADREEIAERLRISYV